MDDDKNVTWSVDLVAYGSDVYSYGGHLSCDTYEQTFWQSND